MVARYRIENFGIMAPRVIAGPGLVIFYANHGLYSTTASEDLHVELLCGKK